MYDPRPGTSPGRAPPYAPSAKPDEPRSADDEEHDPPPGNGADNALNMDMFDTNLNEPPAAAAAEGVPNNTGLLQVADIEITGIFKIKWVYRVDSIQTRPTSTS